MAFFRVVAYAFMFEEDGTIKINKRKGFGARFKWKARQRQEASLFNLRVGTQLLRAPRYPPPGA